MVGIKNNYNYNKLLRKDGRPHVILKRVHAKVDTVGEFKKRG